MQKYVAGKKENPTIIPKAGGIISFIVGEVAIIVLCALFFGLYVRESGIAALLYSDGLTLIQIVCMIFVILFATGLLKEFGYAFMYCVRNDSKETAAQIRKAAFSVKLSMVTALLTGAVITIMMVIGVVYSTLPEQPEYFSPLFATASTGILYGITIVVLLLPVYARLKSKIITKE